MYQKFLLVILLFVFLSTTNVIGATPVKGEIIFSCGFEFPSDPTFFNEWWDPGFKFSFGGGLNIGKNISIIGIFDYGMFGFNVDNYAASFGIPPGYIQVSGGNSNIFSITSGANIYLIPREKSVSPYFTGRFGFVRHHIDDAFIYVPGDTYYIASETRSGFLIYFGGGLSIHATKNINIFTEIKYGIGMMNNTDNRGVIPIDIGMSYIF
jgi:hypothetical protein